MQYCVKNKMPNIVLLLGPRDLKTSSLLRPPVLGHQYTSYTFLFFLPFKTNWLLRPLFVNQKCGLIGVTSLYLKPVH